MLRNKNKRRRIPILAIVVIGAAIAGLALIDVGHIGAQPQSSSTEVGDNTATGAPLTTRTDSSLVWPVVKMLSALAVVILAVYMAMYALKRLNNRRSAGSAAPGSLDLMQTIYVGPHKTVSLVRVGKRSVLVGVTEQNISTLTELTAEETDSLTSAEDVTSRLSQAGNFAGMLEAARDKLKSIAARNKDTAAQSC